MNVTKQFQNEVANKLTRLFNQTFESIMQSQEWREIPSEYINLLELGINNDDCYRDCDYYDDLYNDFNIQNSDATNLFFAKLITKNEIHVVKQRIKKIHNVTKRSLRIAHLLECCSEPQTCYYDNDGLAIPIDQPLGNPIYSPRLDIAIAPSMYMGTKRQNPLISTYPLFKGPLIFEAFSRISLIHQIKLGFERCARENYRRLGLSYNGIVINVRPLCLFGIEIENQLDKKHLMGDFLNAIMLSKYPIVVVPDQYLDECLSMLTLTELIERLKQVNVYELMSKAIVLSVSQFRRVVDRILMANNIEPLGVREFR
jgi:hypothetical protein